MDSYARVEIYSVLSAWIDLIAKRLQCLLESSRFLNLTHWVFDYYLDDC